MKKLTAIIIAVILVLSLATVAFADETTNPGTITIGNAVADQTYSIYKMADLESFSGTSYSYKPVEAWEEFFTAQSAYFTVTDEGYLVMAEGVTLTDAQKAQLAKDALAYAKATDGITATASKTIAESDAQDANTVVFSNLELGYYLVDSTMGTICSLNTTDNTFAIQEKNSKPTVDKVVEEDSKVDDETEGNEWGDTNDADFYQTVNYRTTITVQAGAQNYVLHDKMDAGLTFGKISSVQVNGVNVDAANYTVKTGADCTCKDGEGNAACTFEIAFEDVYVASLTAETQIVVSYTASLNENAVIASTGNVNETWLDYGDNNSTTHDTTTTYVYEFDIIKTDTGNTLLSGAQFKLYDALTGGKEIPLALEADGSYRVAMENEEGVAIVVTDGGPVTITGLDGGTTYYLEETVAPAGYNKLSARVPVVIESSNLNTAYENGQYDPDTHGGVQVVNKTGSQLPETGGLGTLLFTVLGGGTVIGSGILLVTKKRVSKIED